MDVVDGSNGRLPVILEPQECTTLNLSQYITRYSGYTKLQRLQFIANKCPNLQEEAYRLLLEELKRGSNTALYVKIHGMVGLALGMELGKNWIDATEKRETSKLERLEAELMAAKTTMVKESIRLSYNDIGDLHYDRGNLNDANKSFLRARDFCTLPKHTFDMCVRVASTSFNLGQYRNVMNYVTKADEVEGDSLTKAKLNAAAALVLLTEGQYHNAAKKFLEIDSELGDNYSTIIAAEDVALYGTLCALAAMDRSDLRKSLCENANFKSFLELTPSVRVLSQNFMAGKYGDCLLYLETTKSELLLDIHLAKHVAPLTAAITERSIVQYFSPYSSVDMIRMSEALQMTLERLEKEVAALITRGLLPARVDSHTKTLHRTQQEMRSATVERVLKVSHRHLGEIKRGILRLSVMQHNLQVTSSRESSHREGGRGAHRGVGESPGDLTMDVDVDVDGPMQQMYEDEDMADRL